MKRCYACKSEMEPADFHKDRTKKDGLSNRCKSCQARHMKQYVKTPGGAAAKKRAAQTHSGSENGREKRRPRDLRYRQTESAQKTEREQKKRYYKTAAGVDYLRRKARRGVSNGRNAVRMRVVYALRTGRLKRMPCEVCGETKAQAHHDDYSKPLDVRWLCQKHHLQHHKAEIRA